MIRISAISIIRKDEGFESDGESTKSSSNSIDNNVEKLPIHSGSNNVNVDNIVNQQASTNSAGFEEQIVNDHVFIHPNNNKRSLRNTPKSQASPSTSLELETSSAASSGSDYDENVAFKSSGPHSIMIKENTKAVTSIMDGQSCIKGSITIDPNLSSEATSSSATSKSNSPTADLQKYKFDHKETFSVKDIVICHIDKKMGSQVAWVIRSNRRNILILVFECVGGDGDVEQIHKQFNEMKKRSKFEFARRRKTIEPIFNPNSSGNKGKNAVSKSVEVLLGRSRKSIPDPLMLSGNDDFMKPQSTFNSTMSNYTNANFSNKPVMEKQMHNGKDLELLNGHEHHPSLMTLTHDNIGLRHYSHQQFRQKPFDGGIKRHQEGNKMWNLVQHTDSNGITHIEIESKSLPNGLDEEEYNENEHRSIPHAILSKKDSTGKTSMSNNNDNVFEINSKNVSSKSVSKSDKQQNQWDFWISKADEKQRMANFQQSNKSHFAHELESLLTKEIKARNINHSKEEKTDKNNATAQESSIEKAITRIPRPKVPSNTEPLSLRQRAPAMLLKKLDAFSERRNIDVMNGGELNNHEGNLWTKPTINFIGTSNSRHNDQNSISSNQDRGPFPSKMASRTPPPSAKKYQEKKSLFIYETHDAKSDSNSDEISRSIGKLTTEEQNRDNQKKDRLNRIKTDLKQQSSTFFSKENVSKKEKKLLQKVSKSKPYKSSEKQQKSESECNLSTISSSQNNDEAVTINESMSSNKVPMPMSSSSHQLSSMVQKKSSSNDGNNKNKNDEKKETNPQSQTSNQNQILVPTKTGKEPTKKYYPKETNVQHQGGVVFATTGPPSQIPINPALFSNGGRFIHVTPMLPTVQFTAQQLTAQPQSLPMTFPLPLSSNPQVSWTPFANGHDFRSNEQPKSFNPMMHPQALQWRNHQAQLQAAQQVADHHAVALSTNSPNSIPGKASRGRSRERGGDRSTKSEIGISSMEQRRRAQSKSPARQRGLNGSFIGRKHVDLEEYERERERSFIGMEPQSLLSGLQIGKKFRVLGDAVRHAMSGGRKSSSAACATTTPLGTPHLQLKSNLKKHSLPPQQHHNLNVSEPNNSSNTSSQSAVNSSSENNSDWSFDNNATDTSGCSRVDGAGNSTKVTGNLEDKKVHFNKFATVQMME